MQPYLVGVTGGSASGKTYIIERLESAFSSQEITLISQDNYYKDLVDQVPDENGELNFDHPNAMRLELFAEHLERLLEGEAVSVREYTFNNPDKPQRMITYMPHRIVIVEGLFVFYLEKVRKLLNLKVFVEADEHVRLTRRIRRDHTDRGYSLDFILDQYSHYVVPMYRRYVEPYKYDCDIVVPNNHRLEIAVEVLIDHLRSVLERSRAKDEV